MADKEVKNKGVRKFHPSGVYKKLQQIQDYTSKIWVNDITDKTEKVELPPVLQPQRQGEISICHHGINNVRDDKKRTKMYST